VYIVGKFIDQTFYFVIECVRSRTSLEIYWHPPGKACPPVKNHCFETMKLIMFC